MALTLTMKDPSVMGDKMVRIVDIDFDSSYPTGGEALSAADIRMASIEMAIVPNNSGYAFEYDYTNSKLKAYYADYDAVADGALIEVANTTNLSALTDVRAMFIGF